jgi:hypothetical protein
MSEDHRGPAPVVIVINTRRHTWAEKKISFHEVVELAYGTQPVAEGDAFTVSFRRGQAGHGAGTITAGHDVLVKEGMIFDVVRTSRS